MGIFDKKCIHCGSLEHASENCPHGIFQKKCIHCGSLEHTSENCPHGIFQKKCIHCGSLEHTSENCLHGIFQKKCIHCGSIEHSSENCPHGIFQKECIHCGSVNHASEDCPHGFFGKKTPKNNTLKNENNSTSTEADSSQLMFWFIKWGIIITVILVILVIAAFLSPLIFLIFYLIKKRENHLLAILGILASTFLVFDILNGGFLSSKFLNSGRVNKQEMLYYAIGYFAILSTLLVLFFDKYSMQKIPVNSQGNFFQKLNFSKRRPYIIGFGVLLFSIFSIYNFFQNKNNNISHTDNQSEINSDYTIENIDVENNANNQTLNKVGFINGTDVILRENYSIDSKIISVFKESGEEIEILEKYYTDESENSLISNDIITNIKGKSVELKKGKAVKIIESKLNNNQVLISFKGDKNDEVVCLIDRNNLEEMSFNYWYKIMKKDGQIGWVYGKFVNVE